MNLWDTVDFGISEFGTTLGLPGYPARIEGRPSLPTWILRNPEEPIGADAITDAAESFDELLLEVDWIEKLGQGTSMPGVDIDAIAFYLPFHYYPRRWGIYFKESGLLHLTASLYDRTEVSRDRDVLDLALKLLYDHERFHFMTEIAATRVEVVQMMAVYSAFFSHSPGAVLEEALANAQAYRGLRKAPATQIKERVFDWMTNQGPGYRDFCCFLSQPDWDAGQKAITTEILQLTSFSSRVRPLPSPSTFLLPDLGRFNVPQYLVRDRNTRAVTVLKKFPKKYGMEVRAFSNDHPPPHFHIFDTHGRLLSRYRWPELEPMKGDKALPGKLERKLPMYLRDWGTSIKCRLEKNFGTQLRDPEI